MYRKRIRSICNSHRHPFPVRMRYGGTWWHHGRVVHMMRCPACGFQKLFTYVTRMLYRRVG